MDFQSKFSSLLPVTLLYVRYRVSK